MFGKYHTSEISANPVGLTCWREKSNSVTYASMSCVPGERWNPPSSFQKEVMICLGKESSIKHLLYPHLILYQDKLRIKPE